MRRRLSIRLPQKKTPAANSGGFCVNSQAPTEAPRKPSASDVGADDVAEQLPFLALELHQLKLAERGKIGRAGIDLDAGQQDLGPEILEICRLLHDVFAGEVVAALLQHLNQGLCHAVTDHRAAIELVAFREVLGEKSVELLHPGIVVPLRIGGVLQIGSGYDVLRI